MSLSALATRPITVVPVGHLAPWGYQLERSLYESARTLTTLLVETIDVRRQPTEGSPYVATLRESRVLERRNRLLDLQRSLEGRRSQLTNPFLKQAAALMMNLVDRLLRQEGNVRVAQTVPTEESESQTVLTFKYLEEVPDPETPPETPPPPSPLQGIKLFLGLSLGPLTPDLFWSAYESHLFHHRRARGEETTGDRVSIQHTSEELGLGVQAALGMFIHPNLRDTLHPGAKFLFPEFKDGKRETTLVKIVGCRTPS